MNSQIRLKWLTCQQKYLHSNNTLDTKTNSSRPRIHILHPSAMGSTKNGCSVSNSIPIRTWLLASACIESRARTAKLMSRIGCGEEREAVRKGSVCSSTYFASHDKKSAGRVNSTRGRAKYGYGAVYGICWSWSNVNVVQGSHKQSFNNDFV